MKKVHLTINVPEGKFEKLLEILKMNFGDVTIDESEGFDVPEWHQEIVIERIKNSEEKDFFPLDDLDNKISL